MPFFSDLSTLSCIFKKLFCTSALFDNFRTLPMISRLTPDLLPLLWFHSPPLAAAPRVIQQVLLKAVRCNH